MELSIWLSEKKRNYCVLSSSLQIYVSAQVFGVPLAYKTNSLLKVTRWQRRKNRVLLSLTKNKCLCCKAYLSLFRCQCAVTLMTKVQDFSFLSSFISSDVASYVYLVRTVNSHFQISRKICQS